MAQSGTAIFHDGTQTRTADACDPVKAAAAAGRIRLHAWGRASYPGTRLPERRMNEIRSVGLWDATSPQDWGLDWHCNEGIEFTFVARGAVPFATGERSWRLNRGAITITRPWQPHRVGDPGLPPNRLVWLILDVGVRHPNQAWRWPSWLLLSPAERDRLTTLLSHNEQPVFTADRRCAAAFEALAAAVSASDPVQGETPCKLAVNELLVALLSLLERQDLPLDRSLCESQRLVQMFLDELPRHLDHPWTLGGMATACGLGRTRFAHYCRQLCNGNPLDLLNRLRIEQAQRLLIEDPQRSITDIALTCGFASSQYFATRFRSQVGVSPRDWRSAQGAISR